MPKLPYWVSPIRVGQDKAGPYLACDIAATRSERKRGTTLRIPFLDISSMDDAERSKHVATAVHSAAKQIGLIPQEWDLT